MNKSLLKYLLIGVVTPILIGCSEPRLDSSKWHVIALTPVTETGLDSLSLVEIVLLSNMDSLNEPKMLLLENGSISILTANNEVLIKEDFEIKEELKNGRYEIRIGDNDAIFSTKKGDSYLIVNNGRYQLKRF